MEEEREKKEKEERENEKLLVWWSIMRILFYRSFGGYPWPENTKFGCVVRWNSARFFFLYTSLSYSPSELTLYPCLLAFLPVRATKVETKRFLSFFAAFLSVSSSNPPHCHFFSVVASSSRVYHLLLMLWLQPLVSWCYCSPWILFVWVADDFSVPCSPQHPCIISFWKRCQAIVLLYKSEHGFESFPSRCDE